MLIRGPKANLSINFDGLCKKGDPFREGRDASAAGAQYPTVLARADVVANASLHDPDLDGDLH